MAKPQKKLTEALARSSVPIKSKPRRTSVLISSRPTAHGRPPTPPENRTPVTHRRLVDVAQDVTITEEDCGTILGLEVGALKEGEDIIEPLVSVSSAPWSRKTFTMFTNRRVRPARVAGRGWSLIDEDMASRYRESGLETVKIRSFSRVRRSVVSARCERLQLATMGMVDKGEAVESSLRSSIGEPELSLHPHLPRRWNSGTYRRADGANRRSLKDEFGDRPVVVNSEGNKIVTSYEGELTIKSLVSATLRGARLQVPLGATLMVKNGDDVRRIRSFSRDP